MILGATTPPATVGANNKTEGGTYSGGDYYFVIKGDGNNKYLQLLFQATTYNVLLGAFCRTTNSNTGEWNDWKVLSFK